jgi:uncharacterized MAPEG superfamily protein
MPALLLYSIPIAAFLIYVPFGVVAYARFQLARELPDPMTAFGQPRALIEQLPDYARRATWAHQNAFESFALYVPAALMAYLTQVTADLAQWAVLAYLAARLLYPIFYILNIPPLRSLMFGIGSLSLGTLFFLSCQAVGIPFLSPS